MTHKHMSASLYAWNILMVATHERQSLCIKYPDGGNTRAPVFMHETSWWWQHTSASLYAWNILMVATHECQSLCMKHSDGGNTLLDSPPIVPPGILVFNENIVRVEFMYLAFTQAGWELPQAIQVSVVVLMTHWMWNLSNCTLFVDVIQESCKSYQVNPVHNDLLLMWRIILKTHTQKVLCDQVFFPSVQ